MRILIVDQDPGNQKMLNYFLTGEGFDVRVATGGPDALRIVEEEPIDFVILEAVLEPMDGLELCRRIRARFEIPIVFLSSRKEPEDRIAGLEAGADDYIPKPYDFTELLARVQAVQRRTEAFVLADSSDELEVGDLRLDPVTNLVYWQDGASTKLTPIEYRLLHCLMRNAGRTLSHDMLLDAVWGKDANGYSNQISVYMRRLRSKIEPNPDSPKYLTTVRGQGYRFERP